MRTRIGLALALTLAAAGCLLAVSLCHAVGAAEPPINTTASVNPSQQQSRVGEPVKLDPASVKAGEAIYLRGRRASGAPVDAIRAGSDLHARGQDAACVNCHQRSGLGSAEGR